MGITTEQHLEKLEELVKDENNIVSIECLF